MKGFVINLERAVERREAVGKFFDAIPELEFVVVPAVNGKELALPHPDYSEKGYRCCHGKRTNRAQVATFFSHLKALRLFLETSDEHGIIMEDDVQFGPDLLEVANKAIAARPDCGMIRLAGHRNGRPVGLVQLDETYQLGIDTTRQTGTGCYLVDRETAQHLLDKLPPMTLPIDHAFDREWRWSGLTMRVFPFPANQRANTTASQNNALEPEKLSPWIRYWTVFPFRAVNETRRYLYRKGQIARAKRSSA